VGKITYSARGGRVRVQAAKGTAKPERSLEEVVGAMKSGDRPLPGEDYRQKALAIYGLVCGRCGREFTEAKRHLLTIHHRDGNHNYNPPDGSNWEPLCVYCHEDIHSRQILGEYLAGEGGGREAVVVFEDSSENSRGGLGNLGQKLKAAIGEGEKTDT